MIIRYVIGGALAVLGLWFVFNIGYDNGKASAVEQCRERVDGLRNAYDEAEQAARRRANAATREAVEQARAYWQRKAEQDKQTQVIEKEVVKYVEREAAVANSCQLDADFLRIWNAASDKSRNADSAD